MPLALTCIDSITDMNFIFPAGTHRDAKATVDKLARIKENQMLSQKSFRRRYINEKNARFNRNLARFNNEILERKSFLYTHIDEADVDYINEKNARFNRNLARLKNRFLKREIFLHTHDDEADIDEKKARFNRNLARFNSEYSTEIKANLERGTDI